jgi:hypothetical protein
MIAARTASSARLGVQLRGAFLNRQRVRKFAHPFVPSPRCLLDCGRPAGLGSATTPQIYSPLWCEVTVILMKKFTFYTKFDDPRAFVLARCLEYRATHELIPPLILRNLPNGSISSLRNAAYRIIRGRLLRVRLSTLCGSAVHRMMAANGSSLSDMSNSRDRSAHGPMLAPPSEPANSAFLRFRAITRSFCSCRAGVGSPLPLASAFWAEWIAAWKQPASRPTLKPPCAQQLQKLRRQHGMPILTAFAHLDTDQH